MSAVECVLNIISVINPKETESTKVMELQFVPRVNELIKFNIIRQFRVQEVIHHVTANASGYDHSVELIVTLE